jgi:SAM-dependent methyltransferase
MKPSDLTYRLHRYLYGYQRYRLRPETARLYEQIVAKIDQPAFIERFRKYWDPFPSNKAPKFLELNYWFQDSVAQYLWAKIGDDGRKLRVLDIGSGCGYFLVVCRHLGHEVMGLDLDEEALYRDSFDFFGLERMIHRIEPGHPLPPLPRKMDVISAYLTCFNHLPDGSPWSAEGWRFFLDDIRGRLADHGRVIIRFNLNHKTGEFYSRAVEKEIRGLAGFQAKFFLDYALLSTT